MQMIVPEWLYDIWSDDYSHWLAIFLCADEIWCYSIDANWCCCNDSCHLIMITILCSMYIYDMIVDLPTIISWKK